MRRFPRLPLWLELLAVPVLVWLFLQLLVLRPKEAKLAAAQRALLVVEREELAAQLALEKAEAEIARTERKIQTIAEDAVRMKAAESIARAELRTPPRHGWISPRWIMPGESSKSQTAAQRREIRTAE